MENTMNIQKVVDEVSAKLNKGQFGYVVVTKTTPKMNKTNNPYFDRVEKISTYQNAMLGCSYSNVVNNRLQNEGKEGNFTAEAPKGREKYNAFFDRSLKDPNTFYLKIMQYKTQTKITSNYLVDGRLATAEELAQIKSFMPSHSSNAVHQGLEADDEVKMVCPKFDNIFGIVQGENVIYTK